MSRIEKSMLGEPLRAEVETFADFRLAPEGAASVLDVVDLGQEAVGRNESAKALPLHGDPKTAPRNSPNPPDRIYVFHGGCLHLSGGPLNNARRRRAATINLPVAGGEAWRSGDGSSSPGTRVIAVRPLARPQTVSSTGAQCSLLVFPTHPSYRRFAAIPAGRDALELNAQKFARFGDSLVYAQLGALGLDRAHRLFDDIIAVAEPELPHSEEPDPRTAAMVDSLARDPTASLEALAQAMHLSYHHVSHLLATNLGVSFRSCQSVLKARKALALFAHGFPPRLVAEQAGFYDLRHLNRVCYEEFGVAPSFFMSDRVRVHG